MQSVLSDLKLQTRFDWYTKLLFIKWLSCSNHTEFLQKCLTRAFARSETSLMSARSRIPGVRVCVCIDTKINTTENAERERLNLSVRQGQLNFYSIKLVSESSHATHAGGSKNGLKNVWKWLAAGPHCVLRARDAIGRVKSAITPQSIIGGAQLL
jgi:hypothetical protein